MNQIKVKIFGAGSIGNHLAQASRRASWDVTVVDIDPEAIRRMKEEIYPKRYGKWDENIKLVTPEQAPLGGFDVIMIGTPPQARLKLAMAALAEHPKVLQLEKPYFVPLLTEEARAQNEEFLAAAEALGVKVIVGYEYALSENAKKILEFISPAHLGEIRLLEVEVREEWSGALAAHPWLAGPHETYLGFWERGGGALSEHSHAIHYWQHFASHLDLGLINEVSSSLRIVKTESVNYDKLAYLTVKTDRGFTGRIVQDVVTDPPYLSLRIQRKLGFVNWLRRTVPGKGNIETLTFGEKGADGSWSTRIEDVQVSRPDDFYPEIIHIADLLNGEIKIEDSPVRLGLGVHATQVVTAAHKSAAQNSAFIKLNNP